MSELTFSQIGVLEAEAEATEEPFAMNEDAFRLFYARTARPLQSYLARLSGDSALAEDLMQESYFRLLRARLPEGTETKSYLFRIATNLMHDHWRRAGKSRLLAFETSSDAVAVFGMSEHPADRVDRRWDLAGTLERMKPRERELLWLAYAEGMSHREIADILGLRMESIRLVLFRARRKLADLLRKRKLVTAEPEKTKLETDPC